MRVVVIGAGAAGSLVVLHLALRLIEQDSDAPLDVVLLDPADLAHGPAFGTADPRHLLNVPASRMSADPQTASDFVKWCQVEGLLREGDPHYFFAPRAQWARYLRARLTDALERAGSRIRVQHVRSTAHAITTTGTGVRITTDDGTTFDADHVVLATGLPSAGDDWAPPGLAGHSRYVADPWRPGALEPVLDDAGDVLLVGTGLTMADVAISLLSSNENRQVEAISRGGRLPRRHSDEHLPAAIPDITAWGNNLPQIRAAATAHLAAVERLTGDWRPGVDGIRYQTTELWGRLDDTDRAAFVHDLAGEWGVRRHRMPPPTAAVIDSARRAGRLVVRSGKIIGVDAVPDGLVVTTADRERARCAWVVNCTGPRTDLRRLGNPILDSLLGLSGSPALATTDPLGLGLVTDGGRVLDPTGRAGPISAIGALRRGELWESTAIPEIRLQAKELATELIAEATS